MNKPDQQTSVADAEAVIRNLQAKRDALEARGKELDQVRASYAFAAHARDDKAARAKLDQVNKEAAEHGSELASIDAALATARQKLEAAKQHEAKAADRARAQAIRSEWSDAEKDFADLDAGLSFAADAARRLYDRYEIMQQHGLRVPAQLSLMLVDVVTGALMAMPSPLWRELNRAGLEHLSPNRRRNAAALRGAWDLQVQNQAAAIGGEPAPTEAA
jgi:hypothetical protein